MLVRPWVASALLSIIIASNVHATSIYPTADQSLCVLAPELILACVVVACVKDRFKAIVHLAFGSSLSIFCMSIFALMLVRGSI